MIRFQIVEREDTHLMKTLLAAMRQGELRTFVAKRRGTRILHRSPSIPGWITWERSGGVILCSIVSPRSPGDEWHLLSVFLGRLAHRYSDSIHSISIQFGTSGPERPPRRPRRRRSR